VVYIVVIRRRRHIVAVSRRELLSLLLCHHRTIIIIIYCCVQRVRKILAGRFVWWRWRPPRTSVYITYIIIYNNNNNIVWVCALTMNNRRLFHKIYTSGRGILRDVHTHLYNNIQIWNIIHTYYDDDAVEWDAMHVRRKIIYERDARGIVQCTAGLIFTTTTCNNIQE